MFYAVFDSVSFMFDEFFVTSNLPLLKLAVFCYGPPISADLAVCLDGLFLNVYIF